LFSLDNYRLLSFCVLIPAAWRLRKQKDASRIYGLTMMDLSILAFGVLQLITFVPPDLPDHTILQDSATHVLRRAFLYFVDVYVLYYVVSRSCSDRRALIDTLAAFCLASTVLASVAIFETLRTWLLYASLGTRWGLHEIYGTQYGFYFVRNGFLRAQASAGHASALAYLLAIAFGFWLYLRLHVKSVWRRTAIAIVLWLGLLASQARGPILGAVGIYLAFFLLGPRGVPRLLKAVGVLAIAVGGLGLTPFGSRILNSIPFVGQSSENESFDYRQRLAERSWELIQLHPLLGDPLAMTKMEDLRQGEGIIDLVNTYAGITLFYGLIGLACFLAVVILGAFNAYRVSKELQRRDPDYSVLGVCLVACLLGTLFSIASNSFIYAYAILYYLLAGLAAAYAFAGQSRERR
jgi:O-antigen ligase